MEFTDIHTQLSRSAAKQFSLHTGLHWIRTTASSFSEGFYIPYMADRSATTKNESPHDYSYLKRLSYKNQQAVAGYCLPATTKDGLSASAHTFI